jgi:hypothetical protein
MVLSRSAAVAVALGALAVAACGPSRAASGPQIPSLALVDTAGATLSIPDDLSRAKVTVVVFYADHCPVFLAHEERLRELARRHADRGMRLILVDSEVSATTERDARAAAERRLPALVLDPGARLADALGADYATYTVVFDAQGRIRYRGGLDADKERLHDGAEAYVENAVEDLLAGDEPRKTEGKALGCSLQKR